ncbi:MAG TPA: ABC transporter substrate-binding protein [Ilumatobacteraceae bacterium]|nr:ABC transporter substrate-binding protein [Ilumatobacteraceae bacterium]
MSPGTGSAMWATGAAPAAGSRPDAADTDFEPVTIEHADGATTFAAAPERIATIGLQWTDVILAMGETPIAHIADPDAGPGDIYPWQAGLLDDSTGLAITSAQDIPFEQLAALDPDLILVTYLAEDQAVYERLNSIAPTIGLLGDRQVDRWQDMIAVAGQFLGRPAQAEEIVAGVDDVMAGAAAELPGLEGQTFVLANLVPGDAIYVVADPEDGSSVVFQQLGMVLDPDVLAAADGVSGRATFSFEQTALLDGDLLVLFTNGADAGDLVGYDQLAVVAAGASAVVDYASVVGLNTPSPLSIPYSLDVVRPQLAAAAGGAP